MPKCKRFSHQRTVPGTWFAVLAYLSALCIIPLIFQKNNSFVFAHGKQGLVIFVAQVGIFISHILLGTWVLILGMLVLSILSVFGIAAALRGRYVAFPGFSRVADKITL